LDYKTLLRQADEALYRAKRTGKNRVAAQQWGISPMYQASDENPATSLWKCNQSRLIDDHDTIIALLSQKNI
jgi:hypothetical protein